MSPIYKMMGNIVGHVVHETTAAERHEQYRRNIVYVTSKELVADFLRDQIALGSLRNSTQTAVNMLATGRGLDRLLVPGLFKVIVDEADSLLVDEGVTPLIISSSPNDEEAHNAALYREADKLAELLEQHRDFTIDWTARQAELTPARPGSPRRTGRNRKRRLLERQTPPGRTGRPGPQRPLVLSPATSNTSSAKMARFRSSTNSPAA